MLPNYFDLIAGETIVYEVDYSQALPPGATAISSATVTAKKMSIDGTVGITYDELFASTTCAIVSGMVRFTIDGAVAGERYRVEITATTQDSQITKTRMYFRVAAA